jgi:threonine/homoserine/homoserine lactone efflux protein
MDMTTLLSFALLAGLLVMSPGPNGVLIAKTVPTSGKAAGYANIAGFVSAFYLHGTLAIFGFSMILVQSAQLFFIVKMAGAAYLCWIGIKALHDAWRGNTMLQNVTPARRKRDLTKAYLEGFLTNALNPKVAIFYLAAFPQFIGTSGGAVEKAVLLLFIHSLLNIIWFSAMTLMLSRATAALRNSGLQRILKGITGVVFIGFGAKLASLRP